MNEAFNNYYQNNHLSLESILKSNKGKKVIIYQTFEEKSKDFEGIIESCGENYIVLSNPNTGSWNLLLTKYIDYIEFEENINTTY